eukprot:CAMPEP_0119147660 /NCGR_PEP_ID=MMETSP1310-20130426/40699_1 /TAXON_ID=464262 /ORGANISM="Genus nov. species nov., Strain RCC2339" /LENGTH=565 /DNA_ID=CAMNT_0007139641 /DNA_START=111 /DNA_END=1804 /DNA_ORIENTATION=-
MADDRGLQDVFGKLSTSLGVENVEQGLKDLLASAVVKAVGEIGVPNGFLSNDAIKILIPPELQALAGLAQGLGHCETVRSFEESMNHAAERAVPSATDIFARAIAALQFDDVKNIWASPTHTGATEYLQRTCMGSLTEAFTPEVARAMEENQVTKLYDTLTKFVPQIGVMTGNVNLQGYTVQQALRGLFLVCAEKEKAVRNRPEERPTELVQTMFRHLDVEDGPAPVVKDRGGLDFGNVEAKAWSKGDDDEKKERNEGERKEEERRSNGSDDEEKSEDDDDSEKKKKKKEKEKEKTFSKKSNPKRRASLVVKHSSLISSEEKGKYSRKNSRNSRQSLSGSSTEERDEGGKQERDTTLRLSSCSPSTPRARTTTALDSDDSIRVPNLTSMRSSFSAPTSPGRDHIVPTKPATPNVTALKAAGGSISLAASSDGLPLFATVMLYEDLSIQMVRSLDSAPPSIGLLDFVCEEADPKDVLLVCSSLPGVQIVPKIEATSSREVVIQISASRPRRPLVKSLTVLAGDPLFIRPSIRNIVITSNQIDVRKVRWCLNPKSFQKEGYTVFQYP